MLRNEGYRAMCHEYEKPVLTVEQEKAYENLKEHGKELRERICQFITNYTATHSYAPTVREIGAGVGLKSSSSVYSHLTQLEIEGRIETKPYCPRAIRVIGNKE